MLLMTLYGETRSNGFHQTSARKWLFLLENRFTYRDNLMTESETCLKIYEKRRRIEKCLAPLRE